jgi:ketosteroid isomerase-like protein
MNMVIQKIIRIGLMSVVLTTALGSVAEESLESRVQGVMDAYIEASEAEEMDKVMSFYSDDYAMIFSGPDKKQVREKSTEIFSKYEKLDVSLTNLAVTDKGTYVIAIADQVLRGVKSDKPDSSPIVLAEQSVADYLVEKDGRLQFVATAIVDRKKMENITDSAYKNRSIGISVNFPEDWYTAVSMHPSMMEMVIFSSPDHAFTGMYGYLELPYNATAKQAVEGDDNVCRQLARDSFTMLYAKDVEFQGYEGYETITKFHIPQDRGERQRRRVYFKAGGLLHVFVFDTMPPSGWDQAETVFDQILNSFSLEKDSGNQALKSARQEHASGTIVGDIYTNDQLGCQVAAPKGWLMESTNLGGGALFSVNIKPDKETDSLVRFIAWPFPSADDVQLSDILKDHVEGFKKVAKDVVLSPSEELQIAGVKGLSVVAEFTIEGFKRFKRKQVFFIKDKTLFAFLCDSLPPEDYAKLSPSFEEIIQSFTMN